MFSTTTRLILLAAAILPCCIALPASNPVEPVRISADDLVWLDAESARQLNGCRALAYDGTVLFFPDDQGLYGALWTRDFAYMVEGAGDLLLPEEIAAAIYYLLRGQREDGVAPDRVQADGLAVYSAGPPNQPLGEPPTDNSQFLVKLVWNHWKLTGQQNLLRESLPKLQRAMDAVPRNGSGLVWIDPSIRRSPYGFTDTVGKTGAEFFSSLLYWEASQKMVEICRALGERACWQDFQQRAHQVEQSMDLLWSSQAGAYMAAEVDCRQVDVWGNAYAVYIGFPLGEHKNQVLDFLERNFDSYVWRGQIRHLLRGEYWNRLLLDIQPDTYQNGGYWGAASGWVGYALSIRRPDLATRLFNELIQDYRQYKPCEWFYGDTHWLCGYVVSAVQPRGTLRRLISEGKLSTY